MPVYRGPDGKIIEEKTHVPGRKKSEIHERRVDPTADTIKPVRGKPSTGDSDFDAETVKISAKSSGRDEGRDADTVLVGARSRKKDEERRQERAEQSDAMSDPVVGWLVVVEGAGRGRGLPLGLGTNAIGRSSDNRVGLDFGDDQISRTSHAIVTYDPRGRKFYVQHGGGKNLTYLGDEPVLSSTQLPAHCDISIGNTVLRFVPLCGADFDWQDTEDKGD